MDEESHILGCEAQLTRLCNRQMRVVWCLGLPLDRDDLMQAGYMGLLLAERTYNPLKQRTKRGFWAYGRHYAKREIERAIWKQRHVLPRAASHGLPAIQADTRPE